MKVRSNDKAVKYWELSSGSCLHTFDALKNTAYGQINSVAFRSDNNKGAYAANNCQIRIISLTGGYSDTLVEELPCIAHEVVFMGNGTTRILAACEDGKIRCYNVSEL